MKLSYKEKSLRITNPFSLESRGVNTEYPTVDAFLASYAGLVDGSVSYKQAMGISAYWAAVKTISESIASVDFHIMEKMGPRYKIAFDHPLTQLLHYGPNEMQTRFGFFQLALHDLLVYGDYYSELFLKMNGTIEAIEPLTSTKIGLRKIPRNLRLPGEFPYVYVDREEANRILHSQDVWHVVGFGGSPVQGHSTLSTFGKSLGMSLSVDRYGKGFFDNSGRPSGTLTSNIEDMEPEEVENIKAEWQKSNGGDNAQGTAFLWGGFKYQAIGVAPEHAQFLSTKIQQVREVARMFNIPTTKLRDTERSTYSNVEQEAIDFILETLTPWAKRLEHSINKKLLRVPAGDFSCRFVLGALLMGDIRTRYRAYEIAIDKRILTVGEIRHMEGLPTRPVGDPMPPPDDAASQNALKVAEEESRIIEQQKESPESKESFKTRIGNLEDDVEEIKEKQVLNGHVKEPTNAGN